ncbi:protein of unknown function [Shewanella benthica]|uniref:Uncharacterized protein n=1 Tax=Shewanella benthica TaxID=43661 RepID=A0A330LZM1_9GAMM|nr:protein of unknown function [Shewanella benthica]
MMCSPDLLTKTTGLDMWDEGIWADVEESSEAAVCLCFTNSYLTLFFNKYSLRVIAMATLYLLQGQS